MKILCLACSDSYLSKERGAYKGKCIAIIKVNENTGTIKVTAVELKNSSTSVNFKN
ncbi:MAG: hypothetical protein ABI685_04080 [Ferruginibacter sp.]